MTADIKILCFTAAAIGLIHTAAGPDHYLPFIMMAKARRWSSLKTAFITFLCGLGHVLSSVVVGVLGIILGIEIMKIEAFEAFRGSLAAWMIIGGGFAYFIWGLRRAYKNRPHTHLHTHDGHLHSHKHSHTGDHVHVHEKKKNDITPWILFTIFVFGPCEPLIPILMYPAAKSSISGLLLVTGVFSFATIFTMLAIVLIALKGIQLIHLGKIERFSHAIAGGTICLSGLAIQFLGL